MRCQRQTALTSKFAESVPHLLIALPAQPYTWLCQKCAAHHVPPALSQLVKLSVGIYCSLKLLLRLQGGRDFGKGLPRSSPSSLDLLSSHIECQQWTFHLARHYGCQTCGLPASQATVKKSVECHWRACGETVEMLQWLGLAVAADSAYISWRWISSAHC